MQETTLNYDIVIIGSGAGGGTVASELAPLCESGVKIGLLEWGGVVTKEVNTRRELEMANLYYFDGGGFQTRQQDMTLAFAKAVGGSTTVYTGTTLKAPDKVFEKWGIEGINGTDMAPRYEKYIKENNVHFLEDAEINGNNRLFKEGCDNLGWEAKKFPVNTKNCRGLATCNLGCASGAKQGTHEVQIPNATARGVDLISFCRVDEIQGRDVLAEVTEPTDPRLPPSRLKPGRYRFKCGKIVLCAGAIHSPALLMRSIGRKRLPALGRYFTCHPALILVGVHDRPISNVEGFPKTFYCDRFADKERYLLETCMYFPFTLAKNLTGFGHDVDDLMEKYPRLQMILALILDEAEEGNRVDINKKGQPSVSYTFSKKSIAAFAGAVRDSARIFFAAGAKSVHGPAMRRFFIEDFEADQIDELISEEQFKLGKISISAAHLMGGCRMGTDINTSVTNSWGRVHGHENLYVADASLFPACAEVNPYLTIMALANRVSEGIRKDWERGL